MMIYCHQEHILIDPNITDTDILSCRRSIDQPSCVRLSHVLYRLVIERDIQRVLLLSLIFVSSPLILFVSFSVFTSVTCLSHRSASHGRVSALGSSGSERWKIHHSLYFGTFEQYKTTFSNRTPGEPPQTHFYSLTCPIVCVLGPMYKEKVTQIHTFSRKMNICQ